MKKVMIDERWPLKVLDHRDEHWTKNTRWEYERLLAMSTAIKPGDIVLDIGAEEGDLSALYGTWGADLMLMEASRWFWPNIISTLKLNNLNPPLATWVGLAGSETNQIAQSEVPTEIHTESGFTSLVEGGNFIAQIKVDDFLKDKPKPTVISIDVEGAEYDVLVGARGTLEICKPIVFVSVHPEFLKFDYNVTPEDIMAFMKQLGYASEFLGSDHEDHWVFRPL